jgi:hypothetical protein
MARSRIKLFSRCADRAGGSAGRSFRFVFGTTVHDSSLSSLDAAQAPLTQGPRQTGSTSGSGQPTGPASNAASSYDPETQSRLEQIAQSYAQGTCRVDAQATAAKIIDDAFR